MAAQTPPRLIIRPFREPDRKALIALWSDCGLTRPWNPPNRDIDFCRKSGHGRIFVGTLDGALVGSVMAGHDGHRGWLYYVAAAPALQKRGIGAALTRHAEIWLKKLGVPKVMLLIRPDNKRVRRFYEAIGYELEPRILMTRRLDGK